MDVSELINRTFAVWEVSREDEFSPLKNASGSKDTPETCRRDLLLQHIRYVKQAGGLLSYVSVYKI
jgi:UDP-N-acetylglucosamine/UDP-N-acetylgalactosamine diphosphorylase